MKARCPTCHKLNTVHDKTSAIVCKCGVTFTPKFYRKDIPHIHYCACGTVAIRVKSNNYACAKCLAIEERLERDFIRPMTGFPFHGLVTMVCHAEGFA